MPHFMTVLIPYIVIKSFFNNEMSIFEEYGAFNHIHYLLNSPSNCTVVCLFKKDFKLTKNDSYNSCLELFDSSLYIICSTTKLRQSETNLLNFFQ